MDLTRYVDDLQHRLATAADAGGDDARRLAQRLAAPLDAAVRLVLLEALSEAAGEISTELAPGSVDVRLRGGEPEFVVDAGLPASSDAAPTPAPARVPAPTASDLEPDATATSRTTLRLPDHLKAQVEVAAARAGVSVNTWLVRAVAASLGDGAESPTTGPAAPRTGRRVTGWVR